MGNKVLGLPSISVAYLMYIYIYTESSADVLICLQKLLLIKTNFQRYEIHQYENKLTFF